MLHWTWENGANWGTQLIAWALPHAPGYSTPYLSTKDDPNPDNPTIPGVGFDYKPSFAAVANSTNCLKSQTSCTIQYVASNGPGTYDGGDIEFFLVGPSESSSVTADATCYSGCGNNISVTPTKAVVSTDSYGRATMKAHVTFTIDTTTPHNSSASYTFTLGSSYPTIETRNIVVVYY